VPLLEELIMRSLSSLLIVAALAVAPHSMADGDVYEALLSRDTVGAQGFTAAHPEWDGRGVVVAVLDTGVDMSVPGLLKTSTGALKVIEARDFSGEGDVALTRVQITSEDGVAVLRTDDGVVRGADGLSVEPTDGFYWMGFFDEEQVEHSQVHDVNQDGDGEDAFAVVAFRPSGGGEPVVVVDTDGDGSFEGESVRKSYRHQQEWFSFGHADPKKNQTPVAFTVTVFPEGEKKVEIHFDDGGHGTHVAGISTGHGIHGRKGFDGIAPGATVMSLKIGNNNLAGGATTPGSKKRAILYASKWAREHQVPVVMNISYGIGSEIEGKSDIDQALTDALEANPLLVSAVSAGNSGPGLSTVGMPAASARTWCAGAMLTPENAETLWGGKVKGNKVFSFSSRGGELMKPDGLTPGVAWSTVPPHLTRTVMAGTSMASPQAAGIHALLVSAAQSQSVVWTSGSLKQALIASAKPLKGYGLADQGAGLLDVGAAWKVLRKNAKTVLGDTLMDFDVSVPVPHRPGMDGTGIYWRTGTYVPAYPMVQHVKITPVMAPGITDKQRREFFAMLHLESSERWVDLDRSRVGVRHDTPASIEVSLDPKRLTKPGLHEARIVGTLPGVAGPVVTIPVTVVMPYTFTTGETRRRVFSGNLDPGDIDRVYLAVPAGATAMQIRMETPKGKYGDAFMKLHDPDGLRVRSWNTHMSSAKGYVAEVLVSGQDLRPGIWELNPYASFRNKKRSAWAAEVRFLGLELSDHGEYSVATGGDVETSVTVTNRFDRPLHGPVTASLLGVTRTKTLDITGAEESFDVTLGKGSGGARLQLSMSAEHYNQFTDVAVTVTDKTGKAVVLGGFGQRLTAVNFSGSGTYTVKLVGATADPDDHAPKGVEWSVDVEELHRFASPGSLAVDAPEGNPVDLFPGVPLTLDLSSTKAPPQPPEGFDYLAMLSVDDALDDAGPITREITLTGGEDDEDDEDDE
jgi:tripeptidyl-peptidase-2